MVGVGREDLEKKRRVNELRYKNINVNGIDEHPLYTLLKEEIEGISN